MAETSTSVQSHACCTVPPVTGDDYKEKGKYDTVAGMKTYQTGDSNAKTGILVVYDIFGFFPQTIQGADIIASGDSKNPYQVFMPDFFDGKPVPIDWYPPDTEEKGKKLGEFFENEAAPPKTLERIPKVLDELEKKHGIKKWGVVGYCWGGKIVNLSSQSGTRFSSAVAIHPAMVDAADAPKITIPVAIHPAMVDAADAPKITIPIAMFPSKGEDKGDVAKWAEAVKVKNIVRWYPEQEHGFAAARGDLKDDNVRKAYEDCYKNVLDWFHETM